MLHVRPRLRFAIATLALSISPAGQAAAEPEAAAKAGTETASREHVAEMKATIDSVDLDTREVVITTEDGETTTFTAGRDVRNLDQVQPGDTMTISYYETVEVGLASDADTGEPSAVGGVTRAEEGERPGVEAAVVGELVVEFVSYDDRTGVATFVMPDGTVETAVVQPEMRDFAAARTSGERVLITFGQAVAVDISPSTK